MATPEDNQNCHNVHNDFQRCKIKLEKFRFHIWWSGGVRYKNFEPRLFWRI